MLCDWSHVLVDTAKRKPLCGLGKDAITPIDESLHVV
jgi:hypothetical protein